MLYTILCTLLLLNVVRLWLFKVVMIFLLEKLNWRIGLISFNELPKLEKLFQTSPYLTFLVPKFAENESYPTLRELLSGQHQNGFIKQKTIKLNDGSEKKIH
ncbi:PREDICTED: uncharacterized protein LOC108965589 [Bactrocera latifrons]|uniref:uncharacterized protein LOC108965589 n=1 Tax=Bactrocera latifrons TaxID=174628 RepID=UPI0008DDB9A0|nr:PREDICTED: uncharacterized protein LOC108965589 [Bactrocera latifrons]